MSTPKPAINGQELLNRIQQLEEATQALSQQNLKLKDHNQQLEAQIMVTTTATEQTSKAKVNPPELFREEQGKNYYEQNDIEKDDNMAKVIYNYNLFINMLKTTFEEVEECNAATQQLYHIRQKTSPQKYTMRFQQICVNTDWDDKALANMFYQELFDNVKDEIAHLEK
ncbi:hypothetical protein LOZ58_006383 [Ophidiomyces ophidiicola]|nr:hypothetical protein LOZ58_006383 [Ophidiomyces ophidiicola]